MSVYKDRKTGKFVSKATWKRSKAQGGTRYKRVTKPRRKAIARKPRVNTAEFVIHFDYGSLKTKKKGDNRVRFQVHVIGPAGATINDAIDAIRARNAGERWPKGWRKRAIFWGRGKALNSEACVWRTDPLPQNLRVSAIGAGSSKDASHCRLSNRPTGGKRQ